MAIPTSTPQLLDVIRRSRLVDSTTWEDYVLAHPDLPEQPRDLADRLVEYGLLTRFQAKHILAGRYRGLLLGQYRLLDQIGKGGSGVVFVAEHRKLRRKTAIKVLPAERIHEKESLERFYREARAVASLDHPNIVRAHDVNHEGNIHYLVMEYVDGPSLQTYVEQRGALPIKEAARYVVQVAEGLQHAHERGLIHRDIKPANLLLDPSGIVKILDMGLAKFFQEQSDTLTRDLSRGAVLGTADYLSPEQALNCHNVDIRADIYSLGATFYTLLAGRPPFHDSKITQKLIDHQIKEPPKLHELKPEVPVQLSAIVHKMMEKKPEDRLQSPAEVIDQVAPWGHKISPLELPFATPLPFAQPVSAASAGSRKIFAVAGAVAGVLTGLGVILWLAIH
jgi:eukaryotic-like serine/threonine-protein kinase